MHVGLALYGDLERTSGGYRYDRELVDGLEERGHAVDVIALPEPEGGALEQTATSPAIRDRLDRPYDVLLQDELCYRSLVASNEALERPGTVVALVHLLQSPDPAVDDPDLTRRERRYLASVDAAICTSEFTRDRTAALVDGRVPTVVAPPAGRHEGPALAEPTVRERASTDPFRIAFVGNVVPRKNLETVLEALDRVADAIGPWRLTVVGSLAAEPAYARSVQELTADLGLADRVSFRGRVPAGELTSVLERSHVLAVPSRYEGFGMVYLEAMEYGVVPIASGVGGADEVVADGENGFVVDPEDRDRLATVLETLATDRDRLADLGGAALRTAGAHREWDETVTDVIACCRERLDDAATANGGDRP